MGNTGAGHSSSSGSTQPWREQQPYLKELYAQAQGLFRGDPFEFYPGSTVAPRSAWSTEGEELQADRARAGSPNLRAAQDMNRRVVSGEMLGANPYRDAAFEDASRAVRRSYAENLNTIGSRFGGAGRFGSAMAPSGGLWNAKSYADYSMGDTLNRLANTFYLEDYGRERGFMEAARGEAPGLAEADYADASRLREAGASAEGYDQRVLQDLIERFEFGQYEPWERAGMFSNLIGSPVTTSRQKSQSMNIQIS